MYPLKDVAVLYTAANFRNTNLIESSLCLKLFSESSSQFGENLETLVTRPLLSHSYVSLPHVLPGLLFWATLFISLLHLSVTLPSLVEFSQGLCTSPLPFTDHLASSTSPARHAQVSVTSGTSSVLSLLLLLPFTHCLEAGWWDFLFQRVIVMICV